MTSLESFFQDGDPNSWGLVVDTSSPIGCLIAIDTNENILDHFSWGASERHSEILTNKFNQLSKNVQPKKLSHIFYIQGPGSFTGLRVGASFVKALSFANKKIPISCVSSFMPVAIASRKINSNLENFNVLIPSIGNKFFKSEYKYLNNVWVEDIDFDGSKELEQSLMTQTLYSNYTSVQDTDKNIIFTPTSPQDLVDSISAKPLFKRYFKPSTYLDLYPLYLRKSEAEEKFNDKAKL